MLLLIGDVIVSIGVVLWVRDHERMRSRERERERRIFASCARMIGSGSTLPETAGAELVAMYERALEWWREHGAEHASRPLVLGETAVGGRPDTWYATRAELDPNGPQIEWITPVGEFTGPEAAREASRPHYVIRPAPEIGSTADMPPRPFFRP